MTSSIEELENPVVYQYILKLVGEEGIEIINRISDIEYTYKWLKTKSEDPELKDTEREKYKNELELDKDVLINSERSDEDIAEITELNLNSVRHTLYNLYEHRLAEYRRIKNNETGWLTYLWVLKLGNIDSVLKSEMETATSKLSARLNYDESNDFYQCKNCGYMMTFVDAMPVNFICPQCGEMLVHFDDELIIAALRRRVEKMQAELLNEN
ncbi:MAG TPA: transcription factor [Methanocorpusculum sp.]|nr:transcription factor [Methanocorpusculum sp.]